jgi:hypothetical protein
MRRRDASAACVVAGHMCRGAVSDCRADGAVSAPSRWAGEHRHREAGAHLVSGGSSSRWLLSRADGVNCRLAGPAWAWAISQERRAHVVIGAIAWDSAASSPAQNRHRSSLTQRHSESVTEIPGSTASQPLAAVDPTLAVVAGCRQRLSRGEDVVGPENWAGRLPVAHGIAPRVRVGRGGSTCCGCCRSAGSR